MDRAGGWGKGRARGAVGRGGQPPMVAPIPLRGGAAPDRFSPAAGAGDPDRTRGTGPHGVTSTTAAASQDGAGVHFRWLASQCRGCPRGDRCRGADGNPTGHRSVFVRDYHAYLRPAAAGHQPAAGQARLGQRWPGAPTGAGLTRESGGRHARRGGQGAAQGQRFQAGALRTRLRWLRRRARGLAVARPAHQGRRPAGGHQSASRAADAPAAPDQRPDRPRSPADADPERPQSLVRLANAPRDPPQKAPQNHESVTKIRGAASERLEMW